MWSNTLNGTVWDDHCDDNTVDYDDWSKDVTVHDLFPCKYALYRTVGGIPLGCPGSSNVKVKVMVKLII